MKQTDFAICLNRFLADYLVNKRGSTPQTIDSYRYAFIFLLDYYDEVLHISADRITLSVLTYEHLLNFYDWLQTERKKQCFYAESTAGSDKQFYPLPNV